MTRRIRMLFHAVCFSAGSSRVIAGQGTCLPIRPNENVAIQTIADVFISPDYQPVRARLQIATLPAEVTKAYVTDNSTCSTLYDTVSDNVSAMWDLPTAADKAALLASLEIRYYRVGDFYVADLENSSTSGMHLTGRTPLMIIRRSTLQYVGVLLQ